MSVREALKVLADHRILSRELAEAAFLDLMEGRATEAQKGALLMGMAARGEAPPEVAGAVTALRARMKKVPCSRRPLLDTCGTGGDGGNTFNVSTAAALICAGAGVAVAKHGNRSVSSRCGSADVLERAGVRLEKMPEEAAHEIESNNFCFLFAPAFHPAMKEIACARRELAVRTIFNLIGPLANPAGATRQLIGVGKFEIAHLLAEALAMVGMSRAIVFHSENGLDELTPGVPAIGFEVKDGRAARWRFDPGVLAQQPVDREELQGGGPEENVKMLESVLGGREGALRETALLNASAALWLCEMAGTFHEAYEIARAAIDEGKALSVFERARGGA